MLPENKPRPLGRGLWSAYVVLILVPSPKEIAKLRAKAEYLEERGGKVVLTECGTKKRLCAEIDLGAGEYGEDGQFRILKGY